MSIVFKSAKENTMVNDKAQMLVDQALSMKVGQVLRIPTRHLMDAFPVIDIGILRLPPPIDQLLEKLPGSNYGTFFWWREILSGDYMIERREPGPDRVHNYGGRSGFFDSEPTDIYCQPQFSGPKHSYSP